jgi:Na+/alanine symporter
MNPSTRPTQTVRLAALAAVIGFAAIAGFELALAAGGSPAASRLWCGRPPR